MANPCHSEVDSEVDIFAALLRGIESKSTTEAMTTTDVTDATTTTLAELAEVDDLIFDEFVSSLIEEGFEGGQDEGGLERSIASSTESSTASTLLTAHFKSSPPCRHTRRKRSQSHLDDVDGLRCYESSAYLSFAADTGAKRTSKIRI